MQLWKQIPTQDIFMINADLHNLEQYQMVLEWKMGIMKIFVHTLLKYFNAVKFTKEFKIYQKEPPLLHIAVSNV